MDILLALVIVIQMGLTVTNFLRYIDGNQDLTKTLSIVFLWPLYLLKHLWWGLLLVFNGDD